MAKLLQLVGSYTDDKHTGNGGVFDLGKKLQFMTLDVIGQVGFGKSFGLLDIDDDPDEFGMFLSFSSSFSREEFPSTSWIQSPISILDSLITL